MLTYVFTHSYYDSIHNPEIRSEIEDKLRDALIQSDFGETEVELRFKDTVLFKQAPHILSSQAEKMGYFLRFNSAYEVEIRGDEVNQKCLYLFMNSIPETNYEA